MDAATAPVIFCFWSSCARFLTQYQERVARGAVGLTGFSNTCWGRALQLPLYKSSALMRRMANAQQRSGARIRNVYVSHPVQKKLYSTKLLNRYYLWYSVYSGGSLRMGGRGVTVAKWMTKLSGFFFLQICQSFVCLFPFIFSFTVIVYIKMHS